MDRFVIINMKEGLCEEVGGKRKLSKLVGASVPTVSKWFNGRNIFLYGDKIIGMITKN